MKAIVCHQYGPPSTLKLEDVAVPEPGPKEVRVRLKACGVNFPDTLIIRGKYQFKPALPFTPGSDIAGVIDAVGEKVRGHKPGDEVFGFVQTGGFAEMVVAMEDAVAASFLMAYGTSYHALKDRAALQEGETLVVLGASGGVGLAAVELGKLMGARVIACASTSEKLELCREYGADETINYSAEDLKARIKELTGKDGADVIFDPVGGAYSEAALRTMGWNGRYLVVGFAAGDIPKIPLNLMLLKSCQVVGVFWGAFAMKFPNENIGNTMQLMQWHAAGQLKPHLHAVYPLADAAVALEEMMERRVQGKVVINCS